MKQDILPNSIARTSSHTVNRAGREWIPIYCANCGTDGGLVMQTEWDLVQNWAFYLCQPCADKWAPLVNTWVAPDEAFWSKVREAQMNAVGRELSSEEMIEALKDDTHFLTKLAKDRFKKST